MKNPELLEIIVPNIIHSLETIKELYRAGFVEHAKAKRDALRREFQYHTGVDIDKYISEAALDYCEKNNIPLKALKPKMPTKIVGGEPNKPALMAEHIDPIMEFIDKIMEMEDYQQVHQALYDFAPICYITREEDNKLNAAGYRTKRPQGGYKVYEELGISYVPFCQ